MLPTVGPTELLIILVILLIVFGAGRLPEVGRAFGQGIREFRQSIGPEDKGERRLAKQEDWRIKS
ncbi:MAG: twin-arginine translocase TatA/TatE family subunit [Ardenticatenaceae bacterium]|nr:twin-arginine translocase TatA/TatE family subunit [Ardenticatenaceae bacterium]